MPRDEQGYAITVSTSPDEISVEATMGKKRWTVALGKEDVRRITEEAGYERGLKEFGELVACGVEGGVQTVGVDVCDYQGLLERNGSPVPQEVPSRYKRKLYMLVDYNVSYGRALYTIILSQDVVDTVPANPPPRRSSAERESKEISQLRKEVAELKKLNKSLYNRAKKDSELIEGYEARERKMKQQLAALKSELAEVHREMLAARREGAVRVRNTRSSSVNSRDSRASSQASHSSRASKTSAVSRVSRGTISSNRRATSRSPSVHSAHSHSSASSVRRTRYAAPPVPRPSYTASRRTSTPTKRWR